jgi:RNA polymerase sigma-70 factor, ECF subfamily
MPRSFSVGSVPCAVNCSFCFSIPILRKIGGRALHANEEVHAWLAAARGGDEEAFARLVKHYYAPLFRLVFQMVPCAQDVEEILQDSYFRFFKALKRLRPGEDPFPYLRTIATRRTYSFLRHNRMDRVTFEEIPEDLPEINVQGRTLEVQALYRWAATLPAQQRLVFLMREVLGVEDSEIGRLLDIREATVRRHASLARAAMEKDFSEGAF